MSGLIGNALWAARQFIHAIEINPWSSSWAIPQSAAKMSLIAGLFFAHVAHVNSMTEFKAACIALSLVSLAASYAFRKLFLADQIRAGDDQKHSSSGQDENQSAYSRERLRRSSAGPIVSTRPFVFGQQYYSPSTPSSPSPTKKLPRSPPTGRDTRKSNYALALEDEK